MPDTKTALAFIDEAIHALAIEAYRGQHLDERMERAAWRAGAGVTDSNLTWRDSAGLRDVSHLEYDVPQGSSADWLPLPEDACP